MKTIGGKLIGFPGSIIKFYLKVVLFFVLTFYLDFEEGFGWIMAEIQFSAPLVAARDSQGNQGAELYPHVMDIVGLEESTLLSLHSCQSTSSPLFILHYCNRGTKFVVQSAADFRNLRVFEVLGDSGRQADAGQVKVFWQKAWLSRFLMVEGQSAYWIDVVFGEGR